MDLSGLTDEQLDMMRTEPKRRVSATRVKVKGQHLEQQFECQADESEHRRYRVFTRQHARLPHIFSVGLCFTMSSGGDLVLCRYNGGYHSHVNVLEKVKVPATFHIHLATQRYIEAGRDPDGYAVETDRYATMTGALKCLVADCRIEGILDPDEPENLTLDLFPKT